MKFKSIYTCLSVFLLLFTLLSCEKEEKTNPLYKESTNEIKDVMILYSMGHNSLDAFIDENIKTLTTGYLPGNGAKDDVLLVFTRGTESSKDYSTETPSYLIRIYEKKNKVIMDTVLTTDKSTIAASAATMKSILTHISENYHADRYGLALSSHGTGWLPKGYYSNPSYYESSTSASTPLSVGQPVGALPYVEPEYDPSLPMTKSFGQDLVTVNGTNYTYEMDLWDVASAIPMHLSYILFDACLMGGVETAYELKDVCDVIGFSQAEVLATGFDYSTITKYLLKDDSNDPKHVCSDYYDYYAAQTGTSQSATISMIDCSKLDNLASVCKGIFSTYRDAILKVDPSTVQGFFRFNKHWFYDLEDIAEKSGVSDADLAKLKTAIDDCIVYKATTASFLGSFNITAFCGLSMYLPADGSTYLNTFYKKYKWNADTALVE